MNNLNNIPGEIIKTSQLPEDMPTHLVGVILGTSPKTVKYSTTLFASQIASQMTNVVSTSFVYSDPTWLGSLNWNKIINTPSTILGYGITDAVSSSRALSINGTTYDLSANRSWTVGDVLSSGSYSDPSWITSLAWTKISGAPAFLTAESDTLASVTGRGATTTTAVTMGKLTTTGSITAASAIARGVYMNQTLVAAANNDVLVGLDINPSFNNGAFTGVVNYGIRNTSKTTLGDILSVTGGSSTPSNLGNGLHFNFQGGIGWIQSLQSAVQGRQLNVMGNPILFGSSNTGIFYATLFGNGNLTLQNGGTFTDAGFRLDVVGADSRFNGIRAGLGAGQVATNTVFGFNGLNANTTGTQNVAIGYQALRDNTTAVNNVAVGVNALLVTTIGQDNTAIGTSALFKNTASGNTSVGYWSLLENISGTGLVAIGNQALRNSTGNNNTAVGYQAGFAVTTGNNNTAIGASCAIETTTGIRNTYVGALITSSANAANNTAIGTSTVGTGNNNCIMGYLASSGGFGGSVVLGREATATASNQFVIGSNSMPSGAVAIEVNTSTRVWNVIINGTARKILLA